jgi:putative inorganic carbon (hco3(-)) transporter
MRAFAFSGLLLAFVPAVFLCPYIGVLLYCWISFMSPHRLAWGFAAYFSWAMVTAVATVAGWLLSNEQRRLSSDPVFWLIIALTIHVSATMLVALNPDYGFVRWDRAVKGLLFTLVVILLTTNRIRFHALLWVMVISICFYGLKGGLNTILQGGENHILGPADSMISDNNDIALALAVCLPLMNYVRLNTDNVYMRLGLLGVMGASAAAILGTYSRAGLLALVAASLFIWLKSKKKLLSAIVIPIAVGSAIAIMPAKWSERMATIEHYQEDRSAEGRLEIWGAAVKIALARPLTGGGFGATYSQAVIDAYDPGIEARAPHSIYFEVLGEQGFVGLLIWAAILVLGWRNARWIERHSSLQPQLMWANDFARMSQAAVVAYLVGGTFTSFAFWEFYFTIIGLLVAVRKIVKSATVTERRHRLSVAPPTRRSIAVRQPAS